MATRHGFKLMELLSSQIALLIAQMITSLLIPTGIPAKIGILKTQKLAVSMILTISLLLFHAALASGTIFLLT